jgi:N-carbamoyl-L-amino-acid hydrolase
MILGTRTCTGHGKGVVRDSCGPGEEKAHEFVRNAVAALDLEITRDAAANLCMTLPGRLPCATAITSI